MDPPDARPAAPLARLLVIGADAGAPQLFRKWVDSGDLPNLARFWHTGTWGSVENPFALEAGTAWPVFHTGLMPGHQPQYDARRLFDPRDYSFRWYGAAETATPFWRKLSDQGARCLLIDPPYVPLDPQLNGAMIVDWGGHVPANGQQFRFQAHPESLVREVLDVVGPDPAGGRMCDLMAPESLEDYRQFIATYQERIRGKTRLTRHLLVKGGWDFVLACYTDLHCAGHHLWHINDPGHPRYDAAVERALGQPLRDCYRVFDQALGELLAATDERTTVLLLGSHGIGPQYSGTALLDRMLRAIERGAPAPRARSVKASLRALWHQVPLEWRGHLKRLRKPFHGLLHPPTLLGDQVHRRFFEVYANNATGGVRINLEGREAHGKVTRAEYGPLLAHLRSELLKVVNAETGEPVAQEVLVTREHYDGEYLDVLPDLLVRWNRRAAIRRVRSDTIGTLIQEWADARTGDHTPEGMFVARGPGLRARGDIGRVRIADFAPTCAALLGHDIGRTDGRPIAGLLGAGENLAA